MVTTTVRLTWCLLICNRATSEAQYHHQFDVSLFVGVPSSPSAYISSLHIVGYNEEALAKFQWLSFNHLTFHPDFRIEGHQ